MEYTDDQYDLIEKLEKGLNYWQLPEEQQWTLRYLQDEGIAQPRADIADGHYLLTEQGKRILSERRRKLRAAKVEVQQKMQELIDQESARQEDIRREKTNEKKRSDEAAAEKAERKAEKRADRIFQIFLAVLQAFLTFVAGLLTEHFLNVIDFVCFIID